MHSAEQTIWGSANNRPKRGKLMKKQKKRGLVPLLKKVYAPLKLLKVEKFYGFWIFTYVISYMGIIFDLCNAENNNFAESIKNGVIYSTSMAIVSPLFIEFLTGYLSKNRQNEKDEYSSYKAWSIGICLVVLISLFLFYASPLRSSCDWQVFCFIIVLLVSFYTYLVTKMSVHGTIMEEYKDVPYYVVENKLLNSTEAKAKEIKTTTTPDGNEVIL